MDIEKDREIESEAIRLLDDCLVGVEPCVTESECDFDKDRLLKIYSNSKAIVQQNNEDQQLFQVAESVFITCIRFVRCAFLNNNKTLIRGKETNLNSGALLNCVEKDFEHMLKLINKRSANVTAAKTSGRY